MSAKVIQLHPMKQLFPDKPAIISGEVNALVLKDALERAGLIAWHDDDRGLVVIEPAPGRTDGRWPEISDAERLRLAALGRQRWGHLTDAERLALAREAWQAYLAAEEKAQPD